MLLAGIIFAALSIAAGWCYFGSGWTPWLRIPAAIFAGIWGLMGLHALSRAGAWPN